MESFEKLQLLFIEDEFYYLLPVSAVDKISDGRRDPEDMTIINLAGLTGDGVSKYSEKDTYIIELKENNEGFGLSVKEILGLREIEPENQVLLEEPILNICNRFLKSAVWMEEEQIWAYLLDSHQFNSTLQKYDETLIEERLQLSLTEDTDLQETEYIVIEYGGRQFYVEKSKIAGIVTRPRIQRIPQQSEDIMGISRYEEQLIVYVNLIRQDRSGQGGYDCGIIMRAESGMLIGAVGNILGEYKGFLQERLALADGIWEKKCD